VLSLKGKKEMNQRKGQGNHRGRPTPAQSKRQDRSQNRSGPSSFIGRHRRVGNFAEAFRSLSAEDEKAADVLRREGCHRQAVYFFTQAMEKLTRFAIFSEVAPENLDKDGTTYRERTLTHNLDDLLTVLLEVYQETINDPRVSEQISSQLSTHVLQGVRFGVLHNDVRYPRYLDRKQSCLLLKLSEKDSATVALMLARLKQFIEGFQQLDRSEPRQHPAEPPAGKPPPPKPDPPAKPVSEFRF
jgi:hypothetical protein